MKNPILSMFLIIFPIYLLISLHFLDKYYFLCPIEYKRDIIIRNDNRGDGFFAASRSGNRMHQGIDLLAELNTPVLAARFGKVIAATGNNGMGNYVIIRHPGNIITIYGHLSKIYVGKGKFVRQGEIIAAVGKTGNANYHDILPHLHFEIKEYGIPQDPLKYID
jgi:murein DD-endopeptidase MepM/ murein hydrolase activator NlpD